MRSPNIEGNTTSVAQFTLIRVQNIAAIAQETAERAEATKKLSEDMANLSNRLSAAMSKFKLSQQFKKQI